MTDRWFTDEQLAQLSRPTMDRAIEAIDAGDLDEARRLCSEMKHEWQMLHDLMAAGVLDLVSFIQQRLGEDGVAEAWSESMNRGWRRHHDAIVALERRDLVELLAATWRAHSCSGVGPNPGSFTISEDEEKVTFSMNPCGSGQRLVRNGAYEGLPGGGVTQEAHDWSFDRKGLPALLHALLVHERVAADPVVGLPAVPLRAAAGLRQRPVHVALVQGPGRHPRAPLAPIRGCQARALRACSSSRA